MKIIILFLLFSTTSVNVSSQSALKDSAPTEIKVATTIPTNKSIEAPKPESNVNWIMISAIIGIIGSSFVWAYNEWQKRNIKLLTEKEVRYRSLISNIRSFGNGSQNEENANNFNIELHQCWMYCPDVVIHKGNQFLNLLGQDQTKIDIAKGEFILEMRKDLMRSSKLFKFAFNMNRITKLKSTDFRDVYYQATNPEKIE